MPSATIRTSRRAMVIQGHGRRRTVLLVSNKVITNDDRTRLVSSYVRRYLRSYSRLSTTLTKVACERRWLLVPIADPLTKRRILQNVSTGHHVRSVLKILIKGYPFVVIGTKISSYSWSTVVLYQGGYVLARHDQIRRTCQSLRVVPQAQNRFVPQLLRRKQNLHVRGARATSL